MINETRMIEVSGHTVTIRPMCHADADKEREFIRHLSPESMHYRFLGAVRELTPAELRQFCDVDGHHSMAFVAVIEESGGTKIIGVSRYAPNAQSTAREIAVTVADDWQNKGLGKRLAGALIQHAGEHGVKALYSIDLADNAHMRNLARDLGMNATPDPDDAHQIIYSLSLTDLPVPARSGAIIPAAP